MNERHDKNENSQRAFFGRRKGHALRPRQLALFDTLLPNIALDLAKPAPADLRGLFDKPIDDARLEIGFGGAEHLIAQAQLNPRSGFIGSDGFINAIGKALSAIADNALDNIRLHFGDASELIDWLGEGALARIDLLYPDPWPKKRHHKRRLLQPAFVELAASRLAAGGLLHVATDWQEYAEQVLEVLSATPALANTAAGFAARPEWRPETKFERRGLKLGHAVWDLVFARVQR